MKPYMLTAQYNDDNSNDDSIRALCEQQANQGGYFLLNLRSCPKEQDPTWDISLGLAPICLDSSDRLPKPEVTEKRYFLLIRKKFMNRGTTFVRTGKSGSSSDNIVTWDIRSRRSWLVHCDTQEQDGKLYGLFLKRYVVQHAKHDLYRCLTVQEYYHAVNVLTSALALTWLTRKSEMEPPPKH